MVCDFNGEHRLRVFQNRVLRVMFVTEREEVAGGWGTLHNEELHNLYGSPNIIRVIKSDVIRWARYVVCMGEMGNTNKILVGKPEGKGALGRHSRRRKDNIGMDLRENMDWIHLAQDIDQWWALVNTVMNLRVP
jgi:hypothetical protein